MTITRRRLIVLGVLLTIVSLSEGRLLAAQQVGKLFFSCRANNDLYQALRAGGADYPRYDSPAAAVNAAVSGAGVLILADGYPDAPTAVEPAVFAQAAEKKLRVYLEFPAALPDMPVGPIKQDRLLRGVVADDFFGASLPAMRIVGINGCHYVSVEAKGPHLVLAKVAGVDTAVFGLKDTPSDPLLFDHPGGNLLVATGKLSQFVTARYMPHDAWLSIWQTILSRLQPDAAPAKLVWTPTVRPSYGRDEKLPRDVEKRAIGRCVDWIYRSRIMRHPGWPKEVLDRALRYNTVCPMPPADWPLGDGSLGLLEGYSSTIHADGSQPMRYAMRNDNACEVAMFMALGSGILHRPETKTLAVNLLDYIYGASGLSYGSRTDPASPEYGLVGWSLDLPTYYWTDDHGRGLLGMLAVSSVLKSGGDQKTGAKWDEAITKCILADFRTTGAYGFREDCIHTEDLQKNGWRHYWEAKNTKFSPHYVAWLWPCYLWMYHKTGFQPMLTRTETGMRMLMEAYPDRWDWCNRSGSIERARAILPLAWLVRVQDTPEHRAWLRRVAGDLIALQDESGAIREVIGDGGQGTRTNAEYGTCETSLIQANGDPVADMLYTCNFAIIGLHEAAAATGDKFYAKAEDKLARFLCRIQIRSDAHPELDGAWYRGFNFRQWDYWASNADWEWGPWCTETGWTQPWIAGTLALRRMKTSLWDIAAKASPSPNFDQLRRQMLPDEILTSPPTQPAK